AALKAAPGKHMSVNSMLRTVAQQYMLYRWYQLGRCDIGLAAKPGNSNHETGLAMDINPASTWRGSLENHGFKWFGSGDPVHFDYVGSGAVSHKGLDVRAFQRLWNHAHPGDKIAVDGDWGPQTESRMKQSPADGFASGPTCGGSAMNDDDRDDSDG
ncbi:MAG: M15 family metallopeptidase, partial [Minicystis sp.]